MTRLGSPRPKPRFSSPIKSMEVEMDLAAREIAVDLQSLLDYFMPDGTGLGKERLSPAQQLLKFHETVYAHPAGPIAGWGEWLANAHGEIEATVADIPVELRAKWKLDPERVKAITVAFGIQHFARMRKLAEREMLKYGAGISSFPTEGPSLPFPDEGAGVMDYAPS